MAPETRCAAWPPTPPISPPTSRAGGPVILVGHSYGGAVITNTVTGNPDVRSPVYIATFAPDRGESIEALSARFPSIHFMDDPAAPVPTVLSAVATPRPMTRLVSTST